MKPLKTPLLILGVATLLLFFLGSALKISYPEKATRIIGILINDAEASEVPRIDTVIVIDTVYLPAKDENQKIIIPEEQKISICSALGCFTKDGNILKPVKGYIPLQNYIADTLDMPVITNKNVAKYKANGYLVQLTETNHLSFKKKELVKGNEWLTVKSKKFLETFSKAFHGKFKKKLQLSSALRTEEYQAKLTKKNKNATADGSMHTRGCAFDISYRDGKSKSKDLNLTATEIEWIDNWFRTNRPSNVWVTKEEVGSWCYHIVVFNE